MRWLICGSLLAVLACAEAETGGLLAVPVPNDGGKGEEKPDSGVVGGDPDGGFPSEPDPNTEWFKSGTRLRALVIDVGGGARVFRSWYDTALLSFCEFDRADDGEFYCMPIGGYANVFLDPDCRQPGAEQNACNAGQTYFRSPPRQDTLLNQCQLERFDPGRAVGIFQEVGTRAVEELYMSLDQCYVAPVTAATAYVLEPLPLSRLVRATPALRDLGGRLGVWHLEAEDGTQQDLALYDQSREQECSVLHGFDLCATWTALAWVSDDYTTAGCREPLVSASRFENCGPELAMVPAPPTGPLCRPEGGQLHELGEPYFGRVDVRSGDGRCGPAEDFPGELFRLGPPVNRVRFPQVERRLVGNGRLRVERHFSPGATPLTDTSESIIDSQTGQPCQLLYESFFGRPLACGDLTEVGSASLAFADPDCQELLGRQLLRDAPGCRVEPRPVVQVGVSADPSEPCSAVERALFRSGPAYEGPLYERDREGRCRPLVAAPIPGYRFYTHRLGERRQVTDYPRVQQLIE